MTEKFIAGDREIKFMQIAIDLAKKGMEEGSGGPFGTVIVKGDEIIGKGYNCVLANNDPTAHAEIVAIRDACKHIHSFQLTDCEMYTSCEPCPMCLGAIYWARPKVIYYANSRKDAAGAGFDDEFIYREIHLPLVERKIPLINIQDKNALSLFVQWQSLENKISY